VVHFKHFGGKRKKKGGKANKEVGAVPDWREHCIRAARTLKKTPKSGILNWVSFCGHYVVLDQYLRYFLPFLFFASCHLTAVCFEGKKILLLRN